MCCVFKYLLTSSWRKKPRVFEKVLLVGKIRTQDRGKEANFFAKQQILKVESVYVLFNALVVPPMMDVILMMFCFISSINVLIFH